MKIVETDKLMSLLNRDYSVSVDVVPVAVSNTETEVEAIAIIRELKKQRSEYEDSIEPLRKTANAIHKSITAYEKIESAKFAGVILQQERILADYRRVQYEAERSKREAADLEFKIEKERVVAEMRSESFNAFLEGDAEYATEIMSQAKHLENAESDLQPMRGYTFSIIDEAAFIRWALANERSLLNIEIRQGAFKTWVTLGNNSELPFIEKHARFV